MPYNRIDMVSIATADIDKAMLTQYPGYQYFSLSAPTPEVWHPVSSSSSEIPRLSR